MGKLPPLGRMTTYLKGVSDKRQEGKVKHPLATILFIAVTATIANAGSYEEVEAFGQEKEEWLKRFVDMPNGAPSHDTYERVFRWIDGREFERSFILWMREITAEGKLGIVAIDGKTMRGSRDGERNPLHIVSAWASAQNLVLGQIKTEEKSNEITAIPALLDLLDVSGSIVTIDAIGTQREIAEKIVAKKADYVLSVKQNQPTMYDDIDTFVRSEGENDFAEHKHEYCRTVEKGHGRIEKREYYLFNDIEWLDWRDNWKGIKGFGFVRRTVSDLQGKKKRVETAYYITSLPGNANSFATAVRAHWGIESMHWSLDVVLNEDKRTVRKDNGARNLAVLKRMALNIIRADKTLAKASGPLKRFRACMDLEYLETVIRGM